MTSKLHVICKRLGPSHPSCLHFTVFSIALTSHLAFPCRTVLIVQPGAREHDEGLPYILARHGRGYQVDCRGIRAWAKKSFSSSVVNCQTRVPEGSEGSWIEITPTPFWLLDFGIWRSEFSVKQHFFRSRVLKAWKRAEARERTVFFETLEWKVKIQGETFPCIMSTYVYNMYIYIRYVQRYTYFVCIHILDQHKSNSNTKGLRREIAFELLAVRNHMISQFPQDRKSVV